MRRAPLAGLALVAAAFSAVAEHGKKPLPAPAPMAWWWVDLGRTLYPMRIGAGPTVVRDAEAAKSALTPQHPGVDGGPGKPPGHRRREVLRRGRDRASGVRVLRQTPRRREAGEEVESGA
jgi:hypothetical protein